MIKPELKISSTSVFNTRLDKCVESGKPYTIKLEIQDVEGGRYATEIDVLNGGLPSEAIRKASFTIFGLCDAMPKELIMQDCYLMASA